jgi:hypothetical protein
MHLALSLSLSLSSLLSLTLKNQKKTDRMVVGTNHPARYIFHVCCISCGISYETSTFIPVYYTRLLFSRLFFSRAFDEKIPKQHYTDSLTFTAKRSLIYIAGNEL